MLIAALMGVVMIKEYFRNTFETSREAAQALELPILGAIKRHGRFRNKSRCLVTDSNCEKPIVEAYQTLQTNLQYISNDNDKRVYLITSPGPSEGKTITAANLAISMTKAGFRVVLVDGDLRKPQIHEIFGIANSKGVATFLMSGPLDAVPSGNNKNEYKNGLEQLIQKTALPKLNVISSGPQVEHPNEMFGSGRLIDFFEMICTSSEIDTVVIDSPPCLLVPDTLRLANVVNAQVILVLEAGRTSRSSALKAKERFALVGKNITGIVLTKISRPEEDYFGHRSSYRYYGGRFGARPSLKLRLMALIHGREIKEERRYQTSRSDDPHATLFISEDGLREVREQLKTQREPSEQPTETPSEQVAAPATRPARETICPKCGASNALDASFCVQCRTQLPRTLQLDPSVLDKVSAEQTPIVSEKTLELRFPETSQTLRVAVNQDQLIIGRNSGEGLPGPDIDLAPYDAVHHGVSRYHASLTCQGDTLVIKDLESLNHTYINGLRLYPHEARVLRNDDVLMLGELVMHVNLGAPVDSPSQPDQN